MATATSAAKIDATGKVTTLGPSASADASITDDDVKDATKLARLLGTLLASVSALRARWYPRRLDFEDIVTPGTGDAIVLQHNFGGRVRWWVVDWASGVAAAPGLIKSAATTASTLVLTSSGAGTATIRVEESG